MLKFEEEIKKFKPSPTIEEAESVIYSNNFKDIKDIINELMNNIKEEKND